MFNACTYATDFNRDGFSIVNGVLSHHDVAQLRDAVAAIPDGEEVRRKRNVYGVRNLLEVCDDIRQKFSVIVDAAFPAMRLGKHQEPVRHPNV